MVACREGPRSEPKLWREEELRNPKDVYFRVGGVDRLRLVTPRAEGPRSVSCKCTPRAGWTRQSFRAAKGVPSLSSLLISASLRLLAYKLVVPENGGRRSDMLGLSMSLSGLSLRVD